MTPFRLIAVGAMLAVIGFMSLPSVLRRGRFHLRGPFPPVTRRDNPVHYWASVVVQLAIGAFGIAVIGFGIERLLLSR
ncbi:MAG TPA: hypothetical protein VFA12_05320 [Stellaceae bacterium]|nr:hypothetical protein [Stellaceae bacterium]